AEFDLKFVNHELRRLGRSPLAALHEDTLALARRRFPGAQASLDALCRRFEIDLSARTKHGALLDCELLAAVYLELIGGRQPRPGRGAHRRRHRDRGSPPVPAGPPASGAARRAHRPPSAARATEAAALAFVTSL